MSLKCPISHVRNVCKELSNAIEVIVLFDIVQANETGDVAPLVQVVRRFRPLFQLLYIFERILRVDVMSNVLKVALDDFVVLGQTVNGLCIEMHKEVMILTDRMEVRR